MNCVYCGHSNAEDEHRCRHCARRLEAAAVRPAPDYYAGAYSTAATAAAPAPALEQPAEIVEAKPQRAQVPRQTRLFSEGENRKVLPFPSLAKPPEPKPRSRRQGSQGSDSQAFLDFLPPAPHAPRTLKTSVEAVIYCDAQVATPTHRAVGFALDFSLVTIAIGVFLLTFHFCGGEFDTINTGVAIGF